MQTDAICKWCGKPFVAPTRRVCYCSPECARESKIVATRNAARNQYDRIREKRLRKKREIAARRSQSNRIVPGLDDRIVVREGVVVQIRGRVGAAPGAKAVFRINHA